MHDSSDEQEAMQRYGNCTIGSVTKLKLERNYLMRGTATRKATIGLIIELMMKHNIKFDEIDPILYGTGQSYPY